MSACPGVHEKTVRDVTLVIIESPSAMALLIEMNPRDFLGSHNRAPFTIP